MAGVVGAEALDEAGLAGVAVLAQPGVPAAAGVVGGDEEFVVAGELELDPRRWRRWGRPSGSGRSRRWCRLVGEFDGGGELAVGILLGEEGHVVVAGDLERGRSGEAGVMYLLQSAVDEAFLGGALHARCRGRRRLRRGWVARSGAWCGRCRRGRRGRRPRCAARRDRSWGSAARAGLRWACGCGRPGERLEGMRWRRGEGGLLEEISAEWSYSCGPV